MPPISNGWWPAHDGYLRQVRLPAQTSHARVDSEEVTHGNTCQRCRSSIHPMLIPFPIALWIFSLASDCIYLFDRRPVWKDVALYTMIGGIIGALAAAIPGYIDYRSLTDPGHDARRQNAHVHQRRTGFAVHQCGIACS